MKKIVITFLFLLSLARGYAQENNEWVIEFIETVKKGEKDKLAEKLHYPLKRENPTPEIKNKQEFLQRYNEIFDKKLIQMIVNSDHSKDWTSMGWNGIMFLDGVLWLDHEGGLLSVNYESEVEQKRKADIIKADKKNLHPSIIQFKTPVCVMETEKFRIRIDEMNDQTYRYVSWGIDKKMTDKPDLILYKGVLIFDGSGGNHQYEFKNGNYVYICDMRVLREKGTAPAWLNVYLNSKEIISQEAQIK